MKTNQPHKTFDQGKTAQQGGFTLIELVITIVIMGIMALGIMNFISLGAKGYDDSTKRQSMETTGRFVTERLNRELRNAVPNTPATTTGDSCVNFMPIVYAGRYSNIPTSTADKFGFALVDNDITVEDLKGLSLVVNPSSMADLDAATSPQSMVLDEVELVSDTGDIKVFMTKTDGDFLESSVVGSVSKRLYLYRNDVTICMDATRGILRNGVQLEGFIAAGGSFDIGEGGSEMAIARANNAVVHYSFTLLGFDDETEAEKMTFEEDVKVLNAP